MNESDRTWVDGRMAMLSSRLGHFRNDLQPFHFEPTPEFYSALASDQDHALCNATTQIALHLELAAIPPVDYDWGIKMEPQHAGQVRLDGPDRPIRIPFQYAGKGYKLGAILAHELCHVYMFQQGIWASSIDELERLTDLTTVCAGLGKLSLNGTVPVSEGDPAILQQLGYLSHEALVYAFGRINELRGIDEAMARLHLRPEIRWGD